MPTPEEKARENIDRLLAQAGWAVHDQDLTIMQNLAAPPWLVEGPQWRGTIKARLDIFWLRDETLEESANLPAPEVIAADIVEGLEAALEQFRELAADLGADAATEIDRECPETKVRLRNLPLDSR